MKSQNALLTVLKVEHLNDANLPFVVESENLYAPAQYALACARVRGSKRPIRLNIVEADFFQMLVNGDLIGVFSQVFTQSLRDGLAAMKSAAMPARNVNRIFSEHHFHSIKIKAVESCRIGDDTVNHTANPPMIRTQLLMPRWKLSRLYFSLGL